MVASPLLAEWSKPGGNGIVFLAENENRAERLGAVIHALEPSCDVLVFPRLNILPFDQLEPSHEIAGRRSSVLRRLAKHKKPILLVSTAEAAMERLPMPASWSRASFGLKVGSAFSERDVRARLEALGYDLGDEPDYPGGVLFHGNTFEIFPAGALGPFRTEHSGQVIRRIAAFDPIGQEVLSEVKELLIDPMSERLAFGRIRGKRSNLFDYCEQAKWVADAGTSARQQLAEHDRGGGRRTETEREYLGRRDWKRRTTRMKVLFHKAAFRPTPDFSKVASPRKELRAFVDETRGVAGSRLVFVAAQEEDLRAMERFSGLRRNAFLTGAGQRPNATEKRRFWSTSMRVLSCLAGSPCRRDCFRRARQQGSSSAADGQSLECGFRPHRCAGVRLRSRSSAAGTGLARRIAIGGNRRRVVARNDPARICGRRCVLVPPADLALIWPYASEPGELTLDKADGSTWWVRRTEAEQEIQIAGKQLSKHISQRRRRRAPKLAPQAPYMRGSSRAFRISRRSTKRRPFGTSWMILRRPPHGQGDLRRRRVRQDRGSIASGGRRRAVRETGGDCRPTTVLARQHVATFRKRFAPFNIEVGSLSRTTSAAETRRRRRG